MSYGWFVKNWFRIGSKISWKLSFKTLGGLLYFNPAFQNDRVYRIIESKHELVLSWLKERYQYLLDKYKETKDIEDLKEAPKERKIWIMWWQGEENAPILIRKCIESTRRNANGAEVIVITEKNYMDWVDIPNYIIEKHKKGIISFAQLSDIMRIHLIAKHGGLWLDATIWTSQPIPDDIFKMRFFTPHTKLRKTPFVQNDRMHCFIMAGLPGSKIIEYEREFQDTYWKENNVIIDYYLLDYSLMLAYYNIPDIKNEIDSLSYTSDTLYGLVEEMNKQYDKETVNRLLGENIFSKLNRYIKYKEETKGKDTTYKKLIVDN